MKFSHISIPNFNIHTLSTSSSSSSPTHNSSSLSQGKVDSSISSSSSSSSVVSLTSSNSYTFVSVVIVAAKKHAEKLWRPFSFPRNGIPWLSIITVCMLVSMIRFTLIWHPSDDGGGFLNIIDGRHILLLKTKNHARAVSITTGVKEKVPTSNNHMEAEVVIEAGGGVSKKETETETEKEEEKDSLFANGTTTGLMRPFPLHPMEANMTDDEAEFWKQPDGQGYKPCIQFSEEYRRASLTITKEKRKFLIMTVNGGLNQQRNQIIDAVIIARVLEAVLIVPVLEVNYYWGDDSEFSDIFDVEHFKRTLKDDVRIVTALPENHLKHLHVDAINIQYKATPESLRASLSKTLNKDGLMILRALDSKLPKDLSPDLQKLRCKVAFHALRFSVPILEIGKKLSQRMWQKGPYVALHLRLEKDVWVRTGCLSGLGPVFDEEVQIERKLKPHMLTSRVNLTHNDRKLAGFCPLNAGEVARVLRGLGASRNTKVFWAGGDPLGGRLALEPFLEEFPYLYNKEDLALPGELDPFAGKPSILAAIDYLICLNSNVFMNSHGGNMGRALQGHRAYVGHRKHIAPNKRELVRYFMDTTLSEREFARAIREVQNTSLGEPSFRSEKPGRDVVAFPVPECMCNHTIPSH